MPFILITNSKPPYCFDVSHVLALPEHFSHRFRYESRWLGDTEFKNASGCKGMIVLRDFETGGFLPIRLMTIQSVRTVGDIYYIEFRLGSYCDVGERKRTEQLITDRLAEKGVKNEGGEELAVLVIKVDATCLAEEEADKEVDHARWGPLVKALGNLACYREYSFFKILPLEDVSKKQARTAQSEKGEYVWKLQPGTVYFLHVIQHMPSEKERNGAIRNSFDVELRTESEDVQVLRRVQRVVGKYDLLRFIFKTPSTYLNKSSFLELQASQEGRGSEYALPAFFLPIEVGPTRLIRLLLGLRVLVTVLGLVGAFLAEEVADDVGASEGVVRVVGILLVLAGTGRFDETIGGLLQKSGQSVVTKRDDAS